MPSHTTVSEILAAQAQGESAEAITRSFLDAIKQRDPNVRAFLHVDESAALAKARSLDEKRKSSAPLGALAGVPIALKDVLCTKGTPTTCASKILQNFVPPYDAHVIECLRAADAVFIGKTNM